VDIQVLVGDYLVHNHVKLAWLAEMGMAWMGLAEMGMAWMGLVGG
jgi:hypothetical protein